MLTETMSTETKARELNLAELKRKTVLELNGKNPNHPRFGLGGSDRDPQLVKRPYPRRIL